MNGEKHKIIIACAVLLGVVLGPAAYVMIEMKKIRNNEQTQLAMAFQGAAHMTPESQEVYMMSIGSLGKPAIPFLLRIFHAENEAALEGPTIALRMMGHSAVEEISRIALRHDLPIKLRKNALKALGKISGNDALDTLMKVIMDSQELYVLRNQAAGMLTQFDTPKLIEPLFQLLAEESPEVSGLFYQSVVSTLLDVADRLGATLNHEQAKHVKEIIPAHLANSAKPAIRAIAIKFVVSLRAKEFLPTLENLAKSDPVDFIKKEAAAAVTRLSPPPGK